MRRCGTVCFDCLGPTPGAYRGGIGRDARCDRPGGLFHPTNFWAGSESFDQFGVIPTNSDQKKGKIGAESEFH
jgi:hypothetical protein